MALKDNNPTFTYLSWNDLLITYNEETYKIQNGHTNMKYVYWDITNPYILQCYNRTQQQSPGMYQIFINDNGIGTERSHDGLIVSWDGNNTDLIASQIFGLHETNKEIGSKFVAIETDIDGIKQIVGSSGSVDGSLVDRVSKIEQKADEINLSVNKVTQEFSDNKEIVELRENLNKGMIDFNSSLGVFKSEIYTYYKDNKIDSDEKIKINTHLDILDNKKSEVLKYIDIVIVMMREEGQTTQVNKLTSAKTKFVNSVSNLRSYVTTAISDNTIVPSEITGIVDMFAKCSVAINEMKNVCDDCIFLGSGGRISEELARIGIKSDEIVLSVSKTEETIKNNLSIEKNILQGNINDFKGVIDVLTKIINDIAKDGLVSSEEHQVLDKNVANVDIEKADIDKKYNDLYNHVSISASQKATLKAEYDKFNAKYLELKNKIDSVIEDGFFNEAEKLQVGTLINEVLSCLTNLHPIMTQSMDNIQLNTSRKEIEDAKNELQGNINDVIGRVDELGNYVDGTFENNVLDEAERKTIRNNLDTLAREKVDIDNQYAQLSNNKFLDGVLKTNYVTSYNNFVAKYDALVDIIEGILAKHDLINNTDRDNMTNGYNQLNTALGTFVKLSNEVIEYIAKKESEYIKQLLDKDIADVDNKLNDLNNNINTSFKDNIIDESERTLIATNSKDLETQKVDVDNQYNQLILSPFLDGQLKVQFQDKYNVFVTKYNALTKVMSDILSKQDLINNTDRTNLNNAKDKFNLSIGEFSRIVNEVIEYIGRKQSESAVGDFSDQLGALNDKVDNIMGDFEGALADGLLDDAERITINQSLKNLENDFIANEIEYQKVYNNVNLVGNVKVELNNVFNTYKSKYQGLVDTMNYLLNKIGNIDDADRTRLDSAYMEYGESIRLYLSKFYEAMDSITNKGINDAKNEINKEMNDLSSSLDTLENTMNGVFKDGVLSDAEKLAIKQNLQTIELEKIDIDKGYNATYNHANLIGTAKTDLKRVYDAYIVNHNNLVKVINDILAKVGIIDSTDQAKLNTALSQYKISLSEYKIKYNVAIDSITSKGINDAKNEVQGGINDLNNALGDLENTMNNAFKDGVLSDAEKLAMKQHLQTIATEKADVDKQYSTVYNNADLLGSAKSNLKIAYDDYNAKYTTLVSTINTILNKVGLVDSTDQSKLNTAFSNYRTSSGVYSQRINEAIDNIAKVKADNAQNESKKFTEAQIKIVSDAINLKVSQEEYNSNKGEVNKQFSEIKLDVDSITSRVESSEKKQSNNLLRNSNFASPNGKPTDWNIWCSDPKNAGWYLHQHAGFPEGEGIGLQVRTENNSSEIQTHPVRVVKGETYTLSGDIVVEDNISRSQIIFREIYEGGWSDTLHMDLEVGYGGKIKCTHTIQNEKTKNLVILFVHYGAKPNVNGRYVVLFINRMQLEKGATATNWSLSNLDSAENKFSEIKQTTDGITSTVERHQNDLNWLSSETSRIDQKANSIQSTVSNIQGDYVGQSQLTQTVNNFEFKFNTVNAPNLIPNGNPRRNNTIGWSAHGDNCGFYMHHPGDWAGLWSTNTGWETYAFSPRIRLYGGGLYSASFFLQKEVNVESCEVYLIGSRDENLHYDWTHSCTGRIDDNNFRRIKTTVNIPDYIKYVRFRVDNDRNWNGAQGGYVVWFGEFMFIKGDHVYPEQWYPANNESYNDITSINAEGVRVSHENGDFTHVGSSGIKRYRSSGDAKGEYHYLTQYVGFSGKDTVWVQLKDDFRGKNFTAYSVMSDTWEGSWDWGEPWVVQRFVTYVQTDQIDYWNARVPVLIYRVDKNYQTGAYRKMPCAGILLVVG
ncbi:MAG: hypothetical protein ACRC18_06305 [Cetobacterium sp.]